MIGLLFYKVSQQTSPRIFNKLEILSTTLSILINFMVLNSIVDSRGSSSTQTRIQNNIILLERYLLG